ncbi:MAG TPA: 5-formyltetrahydrofolate cyclo-ligase [Verrucomicrobiae bacterium]|nr:5-formyltetrahydrofolate cyclo-ligase [Verrucomicrobiae bacterium]
METIAQEKIALRRQTRAKLAALPAADVHAKSAAIWERLSVLPEFAGATRVLVYVSTGPEVDTHGLIQQLLALGRHVCVPWFDARQQVYVASRLHDFGADLAAGRFGILEPRPGAAEPTACDQIDAALAPGLAFDETGNRLGRGLGHFDSLLQGVRGAKIALAYDFQVLSGVPAEAHDARVDFIVTETRMIRTRGHSP